MRNIASFSIEAASLYFSHRIHSKNRISPGPINLYACNTKAPAASSQIKGGVESSNLFVSLFGRKVPAQRLNRYETEQFQAYSRRMSVTFGPGRKWCQLHHTIALRRYTSMTINKWNCLLSLFLYCHLAHVIYQWSEYRSGSSNIDVSTPSRVERNDTFWLWWCMLDVATIEKRYSTFAKMCVFGWTLFHILLGRQY